MYSHLFRVLSASAAVRITKQFKGNKQAIKQTEIEKLKVKSFHAHADTATE